MSSTDKTAETGAISADEVENFVRTVGETVRMARRKRKLSRRELSEISGVSQRYLAQIEAGEGNISISLLFRISGALEIPVRNLFAANPAAFENDLVSRLYCGATPKAREQAIKILEASQTGGEKRNRICLTGLRGAGKSTIGPLLARALEMPFLELNAVIEQQAGMPVEEIIALYGQEGYRRLERQSLEVIVSENDTLVLAVAGGIVSETDTYEYLLKHFHSIWLRADPQEHMSRVRAQGDERPMAGNPKAMDDLKSILTSRESLYDKADGQIMTSDKSIDETLDEAIRLATNFEAA